MVGTLQMRRLEENLERLRAELVQSVNGEYSRLLDPHVLPLSQQLDQYIVEYYKLKDQLQIP
ncbi:aspartyl-phosphate phosphatase Spo0E family protein [Thermoflavimicrobium dichotomicum]|uniref:Spo0E like sporulation regulatory protein n=1 Tax=Thermoflavimicrobium dichotomicum TaxID=46223 RepID=A0A1I3PQM0_9BACL|nr:aspartyl-phosphate phosphatase Spo0E family protein [Thermoflavimicrobium dichotomicum]SFJ23630.1 Spo0E like sporulation regulatory protein [Thermoflavimicrobium dichotomicum]